MLRRFVVATFCGLAIIIAIGIAFLVRGDEPAGLILILMGTLFAAFNALLVWASRRTFESGPELTGRILPRLPPGGAVWSPQRQAWTWTGGGNVPLVGGFGRMNATIPLA